MVKFLFDLGKHLIGQLAEVRTFRNVLAVDDEPPHGPLHLVSELQVVSPDLHPPFVLLLGQLPSVPMVADSKVIPSGFKALHFRVESSILFIPQSAQVGFVLLD